MIWLIWSISALIPKAKDVLCVIIIIIDIRKASTEIIVLESGTDAMILTVYSLL